MPLIPLRGNATQSDYPLLQARVHYELTDVYLSARLTQTYKSEASVPTQVKYVFPLPPNASVYAFEAVIDRTRVIKGVAKEKKQAKEEYEKAIRQGRTAALLDQKTDDVFEMSLGNIQPKSVVDVNISLLSIVEHDGSLDTLRLTFPTSIAPHYGNAPTSVTTTAPVVDLTLAVTASAPIQSVKSTSHPIETIMGRTTEADAPDFNPSLARVKLSSTQFLQTDVVIVVRCKGLDRPRCTVESFSPAEGAEEHTEAYALTVVPRFESAAIPSQEYIFLVDRSGSMEGGKMAAVRSALKIMLASLPATGSTFNVVSFGSHHDSLWPSCNAYNTETVEDALRHVDQMHANYGGTEIGEAIDGAAALRKAEAGVPTSIFVLTDGETWDLEGVLSGVRRHVQAGKAEKSPVKFFCMGIGNSPSKALVEAIARAGNGVSLFVREDEGASAKLVTLLRAARSTPVENLKIDWGVDDASSAAENEEDFELVPPHTDDNVPTDAPAPPPQPVSLFDESATAGGQDHQLGPAPPPAVVLAPPPRIQQAPSLDSLPPLYTGFRFSVFAIVRQDPKSDSSSQPRRVRISGMAGEQPVSLEVPIHVHSALEPLEAGTKFLHVMAARALIRKFEDRKPMSAKDKAEVLRLAVRYGLSSSQTSFVAVEENPGPESISSSSPRTTELSIADSESEFEYEVIADQFLSTPVGAAPAHGASGYNPIFRPMGPPRATSSSYAAVSSYAGRAPMAALTSYAQMAPPPPPGPYASIAPMAAPSFYASMAPPPPPPPPGTGSFLRRSSASTAPSDAEEADGYDAIPVANDDQLDQLYNPFQPPAQSTAPQPRVSSGLHTHASRRPPTVPKARMASPMLFSTASSRCLVENEPEIQNEDLPTSTASLAQLQRIDGAFPSSEHVYAVVGGDVAKERFKTLSSQSAVPVSDIEVLWTTLLVLAYLELKLADEADEWVLMDEKARAWIAATFNSLPSTSIGAEDAGAGTLVQKMEAEAKKVIEKL